MKRFDLLGVLSFEAASLQAVSFIFLVKPHFDDFQSPSQFITNVTHRRFSTPHCDGGNAMIRPLEQVH